MKLYISQDSYYFVHRNFLPLFEDCNSEIIFVKETKRGILKKYMEIFFEFGLKNFFYICILEIKYFIKLSKRKSKLKAKSINDFELNQFLEFALNSKKFDIVISIGCPCRIDTSLQKKYQLDILNLHGGIIPFQKGRFSPIKALTFKNKYLGATIHKISDYFDQGEVLSQDYIEILIEDSILDCYSKVLRLSFTLLNDFFKGDCKTLPPKVRNYFLNLAEINNEL